MTALTPAARAAITPLSASSKTTVCAGLKPDQLRGRPVALRVWFAVGDIVSGDHHLSIGNPGRGQPGSGKSAIAGGDDGPSVARNTAHQVDRSWNGCHRDRVLDLERVDVRECGGTSIWTDQETSRCPQPACRAPAARWCRGPGRNAAPTGSRRTARWRRNQPAPHRSRTARRLPQS